MPAKKKSASAVAEKPAEQPPKPRKPGNGGKGRVFLIDAMSFIFRAYHAMARQRPMSTRTGVPTAATYVFVNMLRKLRADFEPEFLAAVFDVSAPTFRDEQAKAIKVRKFDSKTQTFKEAEYGGYKANRSEMPPDLVQQLPYIRRALEAYRIPILQSEGFEADDVIGTLANQAAAAGHPVYVVSSDKDMLQLVNDRICVLNPPKDNLICDAAKVEEILGVRPDQVIDVMALRGDSIDNIPGAPGIGDKGSVELIKRFGTLEATLEHASEVERKTYRESLLHNQDTIMMSKQLVTIDTNVPVELELQQMIAGEPEVGALRDLFTELEFTTLLKELAPGADFGETKYSEARTAKDVEAVLTRVSAEHPLAFAVETAAPETPAEEEAPAEESGNLPLLPPSIGSTTVGSSRIAITAEDGEALTVSLGDAAVFAPLRAALANPKVPKVVHDLKAAAHELASRGIALDGVAHDTMLYSYLLDPTYSSHALKDVCLRRLNLQTDGSLAQAADITARLLDLRNEVVQLDLMQVYEQIDRPLVPVLTRMEDAGVKIDCDALAALSTRLAREADAKAKEIYAHVGSEFNINSPKQLSKVLFEDLALPKPVKYGKGKTVSTAVDVLEELALTHDVPRLVLEYRQLSKLKSTYVDALPALCRGDSGRVHTTFNQAGTATGRLSSNNPNLQNIPIRSELGREIRAAFVAEKGNVLLAADYSQIELRLLAHFSEDPLLVEAFRRGDDIHSLTAKEVFGSDDDEHRRRAKVINFGIAYGMSPFGLSQELKIESREARQYIDAYFARYAGVRRFIDATLEQARREQRVRTLFGRVRPIPDINSKNPNMRGFAERTAVNTPLQGTGADLIKLAMIRIDALLRERKLGSRMLLQVHDELVFEVPHAEVEPMKELVIREMQDVHPLSVPLVVEAGIGPNWRDLD